MVLFKLTASCASFDTEPALFVRDFPLFPFCQDMMHECMTSHVRAKILGVIVPNERVMFLDFSSSPHSTSYHRQLIFLECDSRCCATALSLIVNLLRSPRGTEAVTLESA